MDESNKQTAFGSQSLGGEMAATMGMDPRPHMTRDEIRRQLEITGLSEEEWNSAMDDKVAAANRAPF